MTSSARIPAEQIADMRYLHETERKTIVQVQQKYYVYHGDYIRAVLGYRVRVNVAPAPLEEAPVLLERRAKPRPRGYRGGGNPSKAHLVVEACFPGTLRQVAAAAGVGVMTAHRAMTALHEAEPRGIHIGWWRRSTKGNPSAVWCWGDGEDAVCDVEPLPKKIHSRTSRARKKRRETAETERTTERRSTAR